ncbi:podocalyxin-like protein 2 [Amblyraja radiata]|uniref:podocalyxin-like protein 2 n=1 Tax=Amblyraja radiata TaxID=386614 RepID=UPI001401F32D|nr:podocalyxin-like protein 2 [Amblyraja radiata]
MSYTHYLLCALGWLCFNLAIANEAETHVRPAAPGEDLATVTSLDFPSTEVQKDVSGKVADQLDAELLTMAGSFQDESINSQSLSSGTSDAQEKQGTTSDGKMMVSLLPSAQGPGVLPGEPTGQFASTLEAWLSLAAKSTAPGFMPTILSTKATLARPSSVPLASSATLDHPTTQSSPDVDEDLLPTLPPTARVPVVYLDLPTTDPQPASPSHPPLRHPSTVDASGHTEDGGSVLSEDPLSGTRTGVGSTTLDTDYRITMETDSNVEEAGLYPDEFHESKSTTGRTQPEQTMQVVCRDWSKLAGKSYVILNMTENSECEVFRSDRGLELLKIVAETFSRKLSTPANSWLVSLSKPNEDDRHLLMMLASDRGTIPAKEVLAMLGDVKENLKEIGIQNITSATGCQGKPSQPRGDYGKLFVVLVIIGSICAVIIVSGIVYICWQRRLPKLTHMPHGEELHFVENGCHDNPTLDITIDSTVEMQEKKPSVNGDARERSGGWSALVNKGPKDEGDSFEEDTHL